VIYKTVKQNNVLAEYGKADAIPQADVECPADEFENVVRTMGVAFCCEWFGQNDDFAIETIQVLCDRSGINLETIS